MSKWAVSERARVLSLYHRNTPSGPIWHYKYILITNKNLNGDINSLRAKQRYLVR